MTILWTDSTAAFATAGNAPGTWEATRVEIDSRKIKQGDLFVALKGEHFDGHTYVTEALSKGAVAAMVNHVPDGVDPARLLVVDDTLKGLEYLARNARKRSTAKVIGVTGSVGKTSAKEMIRLALSVHGETYATNGNYNNHIGTPLNLANLSSSARFAVFEMGMNHAGEIAHLTRMVKPDIAAITNVEAVHSEFFHSIDGIANAKSEIFEGMKVGGIAIINRDSPHYALMARRADDNSIKNIITFGSHEKADCRLIQYHPANGACTVEASLFGKRIHYTMEAVGRHWAITSLLTLAVAHGLNLDDERTADALVDFGELEGRGSLTYLQVRGGEAVLIDDSYNASPAAMRAAFVKTAEVWQGQQKKARKLAALGNMLELGAKSAELHAELAYDIDREGFDKVFTAGEWMKHLHDMMLPPLRGDHVAQAMALLPILQKELQAGDVLLVKGSHGSKMYELVKALKDKIGTAKPLKATMEKMNAV